MSNTPLPKQVDIRKLIAADITLAAREPLASFERLCAMLESCSGDVEVELHFFVDPQGGRRIDGSVQTQVQVQCQRCLQPMPLELDSQFAVAVVWSDSDAEHLPRELDPYIVGEEPQDVRDLIEDELIISLPYVSYHEVGQCALAGYTNPEPEPAAPADTKENPFKVLEQLKSGKVNK
jgi:uncharacterized protein